VSNEIAHIFVSVQLRDCGRPLSGAAVREWEHSIDIQFPDAYRQFLEVFNGGKFYPAFGYYFPVDFPGTENLPFIVGGIGTFKFFGLGESWPWRDLANIHEIHQGRIPRGRFPSPILPTTWFY
jgi:hypothetical protein